MAVYTKLNQNTLENILSNYDLGKLDDFDIVVQNFKLFTPESLVNKIVWLGYPGLQQLEKVASWISEKHFNTLYLIFPELPCLDWLQTLNKMIDSDWYGVQRSDNMPFWVDKKGRKVFEPGVTWWLAKFIG